MQTLPSNDITTARQRKTKKMHLLQIKKNYGESNQMKLDKFIQDKKPIIYLDGVTGHEVRII